MGRGGERRAIAYANPGIAGEPYATPTLWAAVQYLGAAETPLPQVQQDGRIPYIASLPADKFTPGAYQIRIGVIQGDGKVLN